MKLYKIIFIALALTFSGCAGAPTWENISQDDISQWKELQVDAGQAQTYRKENLTPLDVKNWNDTGLKTQENILNWHKAGFTPSSSKDWVEANISLEEAKAWSKEKFTAEETVNWKNGEFSLKDAIKSRNKGLQPIAN